MCSWKAQNNSEAVGSEAIEEWLSLLGCTGKGLIIGVLPMDPNPRSEGFLVFLSWGG